MVALKEADQRLIALGDPAFLPVREAIAKELQALRNIGVTERQTAAIQLTGLIDAVQTFPVAGPYRAEQRAAPGPEKPLQAPENVSNWKEFLSALWGDIRSLVTIRQHEAAGAPSPLLAPRERYFLYQNLQLKLETARLALLEGNPKVYGSALKEAEKWLNSFFAEEATATRGAIETLNELQGVAVSPELPEISDSLRVLNRVRDRLSGDGGQQGSEPESAAAPQPEAKS